MVKESDWLMFKSVAETLFGTYSQSGAKLRFHIVELLLGVFILYHICCVNYGKLSTFGVEYVV